MRVAPYGWRDEPAEPDPGPGWLRARFVGTRDLRPGVMPCGRARCPVCATRVQSFACEPKTATAEY
jgi:hypothetical protein